MIQYRIKEKGYTLVIFQENPKAQPADSLSLSQLAEVAEKEFPGVKPENLEVSAFIDCQRSVLTMRSTVRYDDDD